MSRQYEPEEVYAAMCIWEALLEMRGGSEREGAPAAATILDERWDGTGVLTMRDWALDMVDAIEAGWREVDGPYGDPFDWEFVPDMLVRAIPLMPERDWAVLTPEEGRTMARLVLAAYEAQEAARGNRS